MMGWTIVLIGFLYFLYQYVVIPLLQAFIDEVNRANEKDNTMPRKMIEYLIGIEDYYKVVSKIGRAHV